MAAPSFPQDLTPSAVVSHSEEDEITQQRIEAFFKKYFMEGPNLESGAGNSNSNSNSNSSSSRWRRPLVAFLLPFCFFQTLWLAMAFKWDYFQYFKDRYHMSVTMIFGSLVAGMTSEGGGAVAYPVMTLLLHTTSAEGRDFALMCQSFGMTAASFTILWMRIRVEWHAILFCSIGAVVGIVFGLEVLDPLLSGDVKKLGFVSVWFSFASVLFLVNRDHARRTFDAIPRLGAWQAAVLVLVGVVGGVLGGLAGTGVDICAFAILTLFFRISEKVATPTTVVMMAINSVIGFGWRHLMSSGGLERESVLYVVCSVPVAVTMAPLGAILAAHFNRHVQAAMLCVFDTLALVTALLVIELRWQLCVMVGLLVGGGAAVFFLLSRLGLKFLEFVEDKELEDAVDRDTRLWMDHVNEVVTEKRRFRFEVRTVTEESEKPGA